jgi:selenocysteine-specific elongation factor
MTSRHVVLGTAGHIDHGKTSLVRALTGVDTDRLPEERARGISIELGFAQFEYGDVQFHVVDVPGHERFIRQMTAGATGMDLALLLVAADDGVMPQTREHLDILRLLGVSVGVVALTKVDLVEPDLVTLALDDVQRLLADSHVGNAPVIPVSSKTGSGLEELRQALVIAVQSLPPRPAGKLFRLPIDRVFSVPGHGTVVTGSVLSGVVQPGDTLELFPARVPVRVRGVQEHGASREMSGPGRRCAINLAGVRDLGIARGAELATPDFLQPATRLLVELTVLDSASEPVLDRLSARLHLGTSEVPARVARVGPPLEPGQTGFAELRLQRPLVAEWGQRFILRRLSPEQTIAGGVVLDPGVPPAARLAESEEQGRWRRDSQPRTRLSAWYAQRGIVEPDPPAAAWSVGIDPLEFPALFDQLQIVGELLPLPGNAGWLHRDFLATLSTTMLQRIRASVVAEQPRRSLPRQTLLNACQNLAPPPVLESGWKQLLAAGLIVPVGENFGPADLQVQLSKAQQSLLSNVLQRIEAGGLAPPTEKELLSELAARSEALQAILTVCVEDHRLVPLGGGFYYTPAALKRARELCTARLSQGPATVSQLREAWGVSRKHGIPLCEYFDARGITLRAGDLRHLGNP